MFMTGESDEYPAWALPLIVRRMLWKEYGVAFGEIQFEDVLKAMRLHSMENQRDKNSSRESSRLLGKLNER